ncbi:Uroporphyrinogen-III synthase [Methylobacterium phyllostachyos]|uniref:Uroporphyrinogen-III synthase n=1 Tax=Methylobacterium phyllostachyos TaxID=582672 RepID=A0A1G9Y9C3_9HYPH|nr:Uroporphyrinogen-III synthase [Methylobacterium phyllostachyos]
MRVWVARPEPGATRTGAALAALGHAPLVAPVLAVRPTGARPPGGPFDALLLTSANAVPALRHIPALPVFAVGARTAALATEAGLGPVHEGPGDAAGLAALVRGFLPPGARLLHAAGAERKPEPAATLTAAGFQVTTCVAYAAEALPTLPGPVDRALADGNLDAVLHYSRRSAAIALALAEDIGHGGAFRRLRHYCLSADVAAPLEAAGVPVHFVAARPREADLLDALAPPPGPACGDREAGPPHLALAPGAAAVLGGRGDAEELEDLPVTPPPSDADKSGSGGRKPDSAPAKAGQLNPSGAEARPGASAGGATGGVKPGPSGPAASGPQPVGAPPKPATEPVVAAKPGTNDAKPSSGPSSGPAAQPSAAKPDALKAEAVGTVPPKDASGKPEAGKPETAKSDPPKPGSAPAADAAKMAAASASPTAPTASATGAAAGKPDAARAEPPKPGQPGAGPQSGAGPQGGPRPGGSPTGAAGAVSAGTVTSGPILDMKAKRIPDPPTGKEPGQGAQARSQTGGKEPPKDPPKETARGPIPGVAAGTTAAAPASRARAGFGSLAAAGLLGGVIGAGLLFGAETAGIGPDPRLNALDQKLSGQIAALSGRLDGLAPRDALAALDKRIGTAESTAKQALDKAGSAPAPDGSASGPAPAVPADLTARLDSLDQRVAALQEEPGRDQPAEAKLNAVQDNGKQIADLESRLKALEAKGGDADAVQKLTALQSEVDQKTQANAAADAALGQRLDALQQSLDARVKAATEAVQAATQASRTAAEAGQTQAAEAAKAVDRRLQEQADRIAALDKSVSQRAETTTVQAALRVVVADRVASALESGTAYAEPLATLRKLDPATEAQAKALAPFADKGAPTAAQLAADFRPIAERIAAKRQAQQAKAKAGSGDFRAKLLSMADGLVQVRKADAPAPEAVDQPEGKVQAALDRGDLTGAEAAFAALPAEARDEAGDFGATLKARAEAEAAARTIIGNTLQALPTGAGSATPASAPAASPSR